MSPTQRCDEIIRLIDDCLRRRDLELLEAQPEHASRRRLSAVWDGQRSQGERSSHANH